MTHAINGSGANGSGSNGADREMHRRLQGEVLKLIQYVQRLRREIAGITRAEGEQTTFEGMADRLDAIVGSTAEATDSILGSMEEIDTLVERLRARPDAAEVDALCDAIGTHTVKAMEACSFQDLTGQRISKVIGSLRFVEERVSAMAEICGRREIEALKDGIRPEPTTDGEVVLEGPQRTEQAISQDEIDSLFN